MACFRRDVILKKIKKNWNDPRFAIKCNAILTAIPKSWKEIILGKKIDPLQEAVKKDTHTLNHAILNEINKTNNKEIRAIATSNLDDSITGRKLWQRKFYVDIWNHFIIATNATLESRLRILHFKILNNI